MLGSAPPLAPYPCYGTIFNDCCISMQGPRPSRQQMKKERRKAAADACTTPTEPPPSVTPTQAPNSTPHVTSPRHPTPAPPSPPPLQRHSSGTSTHPSPPKKTASPNLSTPPQSVTEPSSWRSFRRTTRPLSPPTQPASLPQQVPSYRPTNAVLPTKPPQHFFGGSTRTTRQNDEISTRYQKVPLHDRATLSRTPSQQSNMFSSNDDRQNTANSLNDIKIGSNSLAQEMEALVSDTVWRAKVATKSAASPSFWAAVTTPLVGPKMAFAALLDRYPADHARRAELNKLRVDSQPYSFFRSIRGESHTDPHCVINRHAHILTD